MLLSYPSWYLSDIASVQYTPTYCPGLSATKTLLKLHTQKVLISTYIATSFGYLHVANLRNELSSFLYMLWWLENPSCWKKWQIHL